MLELLSLRDALHIDRRCEELLKVNQSVTVDVDSVHDVIYVPEVSFEPEFLAHDLNTLSEFIFGDGPVAIGVYDLEDFSDLRFLLLGDQLLGQVLEDGCVQLAASREVLQVFEGVLADGLGVRELVACEGLNPLVAEGVLG